MPTNPSFRPACRTKKDINSHRVIVSHDCVFLADDYDVGTVGDTFSFEICGGLWRVRETAAGNPKVNFQHAAMN